MAGVPERICRVRWAIIGDLTEQSEYIFYVAGNNKNVQQKSLVKGRDKFQWKEDGFSALLEAFGKILGQMII